MESLFFAVVLGVSFGALLGTWSAIVASLKDKN
jgi:hypothetical protein